MTMVEHDTRHGSWWTTMPGLLTAFAATITAVGGLVAVLAQTGLLGNLGRDEEGIRTSSAETSSVRTAVPSLSAAPSEQSSSAVPRETVARSPAEVVSGLRGQGFKGVAVTHTDGTVVSLRRTATVNFVPKFPMSNGQTIELDRITSIDVYEPWDGRVRITLMNGQRLDDEAGDLLISGDNELGHYEQFLQKIRRIEFVR